jgi:NADPH-dependent curcumin reductase CurA
MHGATYRAAVEANTVMAGGAIAEVVSSKAPSLKPGDIVFGDTGWQDYAAVPAKHLSRMPKLEPMTHLLSVFGVAGLTAYFGLLHVGKPKEGETVVVSAAAGSVGSIVGQIAKIKGCRVVGIAGGPEKCDFVVRELGFDACIDYKAAREPAALEARLRDATPGGIDGYFENVGGIIFDAVVLQMNAFGRIAVCGMIAGYDGAPLPLAQPAVILRSRLKVQGFVVSEHMALWPKALAELGAGVAAGTLKYRETVASGLDSAPAAFLGLLQGKNFGKQLVKLV